MSENSMLYQTSAPRKRVNITVDQGLLERAKVLGINLSATMDGALVEEIHKRENAQWVRDNSDATNEYNTRIEGGVFSDKLRKF